MTLKEISRRGFVTDGLQAFWHAGNYDGHGNYITNSPFPTSLTDITGNGNDLKLYNFAGTTSSGANGNNTEINPSYVQFDGVDDYCKCQSLENTNYPQNESTVCFVTNIHTMVSFTGWLPKGWGRLFTQIYKFFGNNQIECGFADSSGNFAMIDRPNFNLNQDYMWTITHKSGIGGYIELYVDDVLIDSVNITEHPSNQLFEINLPCLFYWHGVYNRVLSPTEIKQNYNAGFVWNFAPSKLFGTTSVTSFANNSLSSSKFANNSLSTSKFANNTLEVSS